jgi:hypothetical protein|uniref:DegV family EDD domain-containing protein n=1 Tax=Mesoaciditoga lauensis TaxID=1495039 RepID=A0A7V3REN7_9BACT
MKIFVDDSVDNSDFEKIPLYIEWKGGNLRASSIERRSYFSLNKKSSIALPSYEEVNEMISKYDSVKILLPSKPLNFLKETISFISTIVDGIDLIEEKMDSVALSLFLDGKRPLEEADAFAKRSSTYLLFSDLSFLRKNDVISEKKESMILTKMINVVKVGFGRTSVKSSWSLKSALSLIFEDIGSTSPSMIAFRYSGRTKTMDSIIKEFSSKFKSKFSVGWMNPVSAALYGHETITITIISEEDKNG